MTFDGAVIKEQHVTFAIAVVQPHALGLSERDKTLAEFTRFFQIPTVIMAQDSRGVPELFGRKDIVEFLAGIDLSRIPWRRYTV